MNLRTARNTLLFASILLSACSSATPPEKTASSTVTLSTVQVNANRMLVLAVDSTVPNLRVTLNDVPLYEASEATTSYQTQLNMWLKNGKNKLSFFVPDSASGKTLRLMVLSQNQAKPILNQTFLPEQLQQKSVIWSFVLEGSGFPVRPWEAATSREDDDMVQQEIRTAFWEIRSAFGQNDIEQLTSLARTRNTTFATNIGMDPKQFELAIVQDWQSNLNGEYLKPTAQWDIRGVRAWDGKLWKVINSQKRDPLCFADEGDSEVCFEVFLSQIGGKWIWVY